MESFDRIAPPGLRATALAVLLLAGCAGPRVAIEAQEAFDSASTYSRTYAALEAQTCEAARRALLSQGYVISASTSDRVRGRKSFQPSADAHAEIEFTVVCAREGHEGRRTIAFVNAVQESYTLRKTSNSASVGVSPFGSLSLPFGGSEEALVKVGSLTITSAPFYQRFFQLVERYLAGDSGQYLAPPTDARASPAAGASSPPS
ncbi:MAG TPA: DUF2242 domain-containing protein [Caldimonas sp.]|jgi:hypothetical protein|nr:DUF2242 domain-containing protein [Caldimonas sp.]HEX2543065.1 DUF2242 domain-containing protein [Caldimonas sp.]